MPDEIIMEDGKMDLTGCRDLELQPYGAGFIRVTKKGIILTQDISRVRHIVFRSTSYGYDATTIAKIISSYKDGPCSICSRDIPVAQKNVIGTIGSKFYMYCTNCKGIASFCIDRSRRFKVRKDKPIIVLKPHTVIEVTTSSKVTYYVLPGTFKINGDSITFYGAYTIGGKNYKHDKLEREISIVKLRNGDVIKRSGWYDKDGNLLEKFAEETKEPPPIKEIETRLGAKYEVTQVDEITFDRFVFWAKKKHDGGSEIKVTLLKSAISIVKLANGKSHGPYEIVFPLYKRAG
jgi:hypothetical protein